MNIVEAYNYLTDKIREYFTEVDLGAKEPELHYHSAQKARLTIENLISKNLTPSLMGMENLKEDRKVQWGNGGGLPKGWDCYRVSTFMEVIRAKWDRALQAQQLFIDAQIEIKMLEGVQKVLDEMKKPSQETTQRLSELQSKIQKLEFDGLDSMKDAFNYSRELLQQIESQNNLYRENRLR